MVYDFFMLCGLRSDEITDNEAFANIPKPREELVTMRKVTKERRKWVLILGTRLLMVSLMIRRLTEPRLELFPISPRL